MEEKIMENVAETMENVVEATSDKKALAIGGAVVAAGVVAVGAVARKCWKKIKSKKNASEEVEDAETIETAEDESDEVK